MHAGSFRDGGIGISVALSVLGASSAFIIGLTVAFVSPAGAQPQPHNILLLTSFQSDSFTFHNEVFRTARSCADSCRNH